jgi:hypothetical protein
MRREVLKGTTRVQTMIYEVLLRDYPGTGEVESYHDEQRDNKRQ